MAKILVVDDAAFLRMSLKKILAAEDHMIYEASNGVEAITLYQEIRPDVVTMDITMPDMDGLELCRILSAEYNVPIIMLTARADMEDKLKGLESGADDYITKPFDMREVTGRLRAVMRRFEKAHQVRHEETTAEDSSSVMQKGRLIELTPKEYELLCYLLRHPREALSRQVLLEEVWGYDFMGDTRTVDIHIQRLRKKMSLDGHLLTVFGVGYKYVP